MLYHVQETELFYTLGEPTALAVWQQMRDLSIEAVCYLLLMLITLIFSKVHTLNVSQSIIVQESIRSIEYWV